MTRQINNAIDAALSELRSYRNEAARAGAVSKAEKINAAIVQLKGAAQNLAEARA